MRTIGRISLLVLLLAAGVTLVVPDDWRWPWSSAPTVQAPGGGGGGGRRGRGGPAGPVAVLAAPVRVADVPVTIDGVGTARPAATVTVRSQVDGQLLELRFREGQDVRKGDLLARIDPTIYQAQLDQALAKKSQDEAQLDNARRDLDRYVRLAETNSVTKQQADTQRAVVAQLVAQVQADQAAIDNARAVLAYTRIVSPIDGRTGIRVVDEGNLVRASDAAGLVTVSQIRPISVLFSIPQQQLQRIARALAAGPVQVDALDSDNQNAVDRGTLQVIDNQVDPATGSVRMKAEFPNRDLGLWPGGFVNVRLQVETLRGVTVTATAAVQRGPQGTFVYLVKADDTVTVRPVAVVQQDDVQAVITGVAQGDRVVTSGFSRLSEGTRVTVVEPPPAPGAPPSVASPPVAATPASPPVPGAAESRPRGQGEGRPRGERRPGDPAAPGGPRQGAAGTGPSPAAGAGAGTAPAVRTP
ncbi:MAG: efflux RND transporter periplasmic adaptor subunit [Alsobacter sp.]